MKRILSCLFSLVLLAGLLIPSQALAAGNPVPDAKKAVICIASGIGYQADGQPVILNGQYYSMGTGFGVSAKDGDAYVFATNNHVVSDDNGNVYEYVYIMIDGADLSNASTLVRAKVLYADSTTDTAIIQADAPIPGVTALPLHSAQDIQTGAEVFALGFPGIADEVADTNHYTVEDITVTDGIVSRHIQNRGNKCMAHTAKINHGNSGGPLINSSGQAVGMNTFGYTDAQAADARYYAMYIDYTMAALDQLHIPYRTGSSVQLPNRKMMLIAAAGAVVIVAVIVVLVRSRKKDPVPQEPAASVPVTPTKPTHPSGVNVVVLSGPMTGRSWPLDSCIKVGRDPQADIVFPADTTGVSRMHCQIELLNGKVCITDLHSTYGTTVNGQRIAANTPVPLSQNAAICLGSSKNRITVR